MPMLPTYVQATGVDSKIANGASEHYSNYTTATAVAAAAAAVAASVPTFVPAQYP
jgi:hypothetical protein